MESLLVEWVEVKQTLDKFVVYPSNDCIQAAVDVIRALDGDCCLHDEILSTLVFSLMITVFGERSALWGSQLAEAIKWKGVERVMVSRANFLVAMVLAPMVQKVEEVISRLSADTIRNVPYQYNDDSKNILAQHFHYYSVNEQTSEIKLYETRTDPKFMDSWFKVNVVSSFGSLLLLLYLLEGEDEVAFDFEGAKLNRDGPLCLIQLVCSKDPTQVHVIDMWVLGKEALDVSTSSGLTLRGILTSDTVTKLWFDPRNDVDALYHQFGTKPGKVLDLQLLYVYSRRYRGEHVLHVPGLGRCVKECCRVEFLSSIKNIGQGLCNSNNYACFKKRPLDPALIVYAAADVR